MSLLALLYSTVGLLVLIGYIPQLYRLWTTDTDCRDVSIAAWATWTYTSSVSLLYSVYELPDPKFAMVNAVNLSCILAIIALTLHRRRRFAERARDAATRLAELAPVSMPGTLDPVLIPLPRDDERAAAGSQRWQLGQ